MTPPAKHLTIAARPLGWTVAVCVVAFAVVLGLVAAHWPPLLTGDQAADNAAHVDVLAQSWLLAAARAVTIAGSSLVVNVVAAVAAIVLLIMRLWRGAVLVVVARLGELASATAVKDLLARPRPTLLNPVDHGAGYSFPSGHAAGAAAVYGALVVLVLPRAARWARALLLAAGALLICAVAASRVLLGVHYPSDVAAGAALGLAWVGIAALLITLIRPGGVGT
ncbi:MAG: phosphoesterase PA-phosphatase related protein [Pseudonocardiales bacterium]|nr:phosphoesterase PA-phosphatase related protein [Pseudonocardiales bacterium]